MRPEGALSSAEVAAVLGTNRERVVALAKTGELGSVRIGHRYWFTEPAVRLFMDRRSDARSDALASLMPADGYRDDEF